MNTITSALWKCYLPIDQQLLPPSDDTEDILVAILPVLTSALDTPLVTGYKAQVEFLSAGYRLCWVVFAAFNDLYSRHELPHQLLKAICTPISIQDCDFNDSKQWRVHVGRINSGVWPPLELPLPFSPATIIIVWGSCPRAETAAMSELDELCGDLQLSCLVVSCFDGYHDLAFTYDGEQVLIIKDLNPNSMLSLDFLRALHSDDNPLHGLVYLYLMFTAQPSLCWGDETEEWLQFVRTSVHDTWKYDSDGIRSKDSAYYFESLINVPVELQVPSPPPQEQYDAFNMRLHSNKRRRLEYLNDSLDDARPFSSKVVYTDESHNDDNPQRIHYPSMLHRQPSGKEEAIPNVIVAPLPARPIARYTPPKPTTTVTQSINERLRFNAELSDRKTKKRRLIQAEQLKAKMDRQRQFEYAQHKSLPNGRCSCSRYLPNSTMKPVAKCELGQPTVQDLLDAASHYAHHDGTPCDGRIKPWTGVTLKGTPAEAPENWKGPFCYCYDH